MPTAVARTRLAPPTAPLIRALLDDAAAGVLLLDPAGRVSEHNAAAERLLALTAAGLRGVDAAGLLRTVVAGDDLVREAFRAAKVEREVVLHTAKAGDIPVRFRSYRLGKPPWVLVTLLDLTQLRRMQQELRRHERLATLGQLSAGVAHEIRNPLAGIGTSAQVLLKRFEPRDDRARFVQVILEEVARLDRIVTSLLQYARPRTPELRPATLAACVEKVIGLAADAIEGSGVKVEIDVAPRLATLYIDPDLVTQVLLNVTLNAVQASPKGGVLRYEIRKVRRRRPPRGPGRRAEDSGMDRRTSDRAGADRRREGTAADRRSDGDGWLAYQQVRVMLSPFAMAFLQWEVKEHRGTASLAAVDGDRASMLLDDRLRDAEPQAGALGPGGEERIEHLLEHTFRDADAGIDDAHLLVG